MAANQSEISRQRIRIGEEAVVLNAERKGVPQWKTLGEIPLARLREIKRRGVGQTEGTRKMGRYAILRLHG